MRDLISAYGFLIGLRERITGLQFAERIESYSSSAQAQYYAAVARRAQNFERQYSAMTLEYVAGWNKQFAWRSN